MKPLPKGKDFTHSLSSWDGFDESGIRELEGDEYQSLSGGEDVGIEIRGIGKKLKRNRR